MRLIVARVGPRIAFSIEGGKGCEVMLMLVVEEEEEEEEEEVCSRDESSS